MLLRSCCCDAVGESGSTAFFLPAAAERKLEAELVRSCTAVAVDPRREDAVKSGIDEEVNPADGGLAVCTAAGGWRTPDGGRDVTAAAAVGGRLLPSRGASAFLLESLFSLTLSSPSLASLAFS